MVSEGFVSGGADDMKVQIVACSFDNYAYLVHREGSSKALVIDPSEGIPVLREAEHLGLELVAVLCTHHHHDHVGGIAEVREAFPTIEVWAHEHDRHRIAGVTHTVQHAQTIVVGGMSFSALHVPGHTLGSVAWICSNLLWTGDTLFVGGCGRVFEGTPTMMQASLQRLASLPQDTQVYCGHEYTLSNLRFARLVESGHDPIQKHLRQAETLRAENKPTVPSTIGQELLINPFLRWCEPEVIAFALRNGARDKTPTSVFAVVREAKNKT
ncbi:MAG TPA: hydroxyacylglutathione hydrolase [Polyangiaceae bacterium]|nr:hydroxyacylglutathione hydrolase [Polyangiaceae bacterium]